MNDQPETLPITHLADAMLQAADTIEAVNTYYKMPPDCQWRPSTLRKESKHVAAEADPTKETAETVVAEITIDRSELIPGGNGARIGFSDAFPDKQFLFLPAKADPGE